MVKRVNLTRLALLILVTLFVPAQYSHADQNHPELDDLFDSLKQAENDAQTRDIQNRIWQRWLEAPDFNSEALLSQVAVAMQQRQYTLALKLCNQLVDSSPEYAEGWNKRATVRYLLGDHRESAADIQKTLELEPRHFGALSGLGLIFMAAGDYEGALDAFERVLAISPESANAQGSVARAKGRLGSEI